MLFDRCLGSGLLPPLAAHKLYIGWRPHPETLKHLAAESHGVKKKHDYMGMLWRSHTNGLANGY